MYLTIRIVTSYQLVIANAQTTYTSFVIYMWLKAISMNNIKHYYVCNNVIASCRLFQSDGTISSPVVLMINFMWVCHSQDIGKR